MFDPMNDSVTYAAAHGRNGNDQDSMRQVSHRGGSVAKLSRMETGVDEEHLDFTVSDDVDGKKGGSISGRRSSGAKLLASPKKRRAVKKNKMRWVIKGLIAVFVLLLLADYIRRFNAANTVVPRKTSKRNNSNGAVKRNNPLKGAVPFVETEDVRKEPMRAATPPSKPVEMFDGAPVVEATQDDVIVNVLRENIVRPELVKHAVLDQTELMLRKMELTPEEEDVMPEEVVTFDADELWANMGFQS